MHYFLNKYNRNMTHNIQCIKINYTKIISLFLNIKIIYTTSYNKRTDPENNVTIIESIWVLLNLERVLFIWSSFFYAQWKLSTKSSQTCENNGTFKWQLRLLSVVNIAYHYSLKQNVTYRPYDRRKVEDFCDLIVATS